MLTTHRRLVIAFLTLSLFAVTAWLGVERRANASGDTSTVIVQLKGEPAAVRAARVTQSGGTVTDADLQSFREQIRAEQNNFLASLASRGVSATVVSRSIKNYDGSVAAQTDLRYTLVYNGMALSVERASIPALKAMPEVKSVNANDFLYTQLHGSVGYINAPKVYGAVKELSPFDDLREGFEGQGINIAIIDTGIDWTHPMFGGDPTPPRLGVAPVAAAVQTNQKVIYNLPLTDIGANDGFGHGTHVASTAAGYLARHPGSDGLPLTADDLNLHGVAPQAKLMSYTVCSNIRSIPGSLGLPSVGGCESADTIMALEDSVSPFTLTGFPKPKAHVINLSLGGAGGPDSPTAVACSNAALTGATVVASSGNSGPGEGTTGAPAAGTHVISVGANTHPGAANSQWSADLLQASAVPQSQTGAVTPANNLATAAGFSRLKLFPMSGTPNPPAGSLAQRYVFVNNPTVTWPAAVSGRIALVKGTGLPTAPFAYISNMAAASGAVGVLLVSTTETPTAGKGTIPSANIKPADAEILIDAISSTDNNNVDPPNGAISELPIRLNPFFSEAFQGEMGGFSSRGPVRGLGQVKPDVSAPGVAVLAAVPPASLLGAIGTLEGTPNYAHLDGTSMSSPHTAGAAALIKQAHPGWTPDMIRTALINTATNMRNETGAPKAEGLTADSIIAQGGGLIDVKEAVNAQALIGVRGDGITTPGILGSHSYGEVPVINNRVSNTVPVTVAVRDLSGQGGTYNLAVANNRDLQLAGINVSTSSTSVNVPANGEATFTVSATVDGDLLRDIMAAKTIGTEVIFERIQMQWYITANRSDNGESLRMPFFFRPGKSLPQTPVVTDQSFEGLVVVGDAGQQLESGVTYVDVPFEVSAGSYRVEARLEWLTQEAQDMDFELRDPSGAVIASSGVLGGPEQFTKDLSAPGTYVYRVVGYANGPVPFTITGKLYSGPSAPSVTPISGEYTDGQGNAVDFDGSFNVTWQNVGGERSYEVERSTDGGQNWSLVATTGAGTTSLALNGLPNGTYSFRVRGLHDGQRGFYVTPASAAQSIVVDQRTASDVTSLILVVNKSITFSAGFVDIDQTLKNKSVDTTIYPLVSFNVIAVESTSGQVRAVNSDNGGDGAGAAAAYDYSRQLPGDDLTPGEESGVRRLRFSNPNMELFRFTAVVRGHLRSAGGAAASAPESGGAAASSGGGSANLLPNATGQVLTFTVNPLTRSIRLVN